jgi:hypothetical protein
MFELLVTALVGNLKPSILKKNADDLSAAQHALPLSK